MKFKIKILTLFGVGLILILGNTLYHYYNEKSIQHALDKWGLYHNFSIETIYGQKKVYKNHDYLTPNTMYFGFKVSSKDFEILKTQWNLKSVESMEGKKHLEQWNRFWNQTFDIQRSFCSQFYSNLGASPYWWSHSYLKMNQIYVASIRPATAYTDFGFHLIVYTDGEKVFGMTDEFMH